jgi:hypothetical protein
MYSMEIISPDTQYHCLISSSYKYTLPNQTKIEQRALGPYIPTQAPPTTGMY